jgi:nucleoside-diphosphate-sugar epimerase
MEVYVSIGCAFATCLWLIKRSKLQQSLDRFIRPKIEFQIIRGERWEGARTVLITGGNGFLGKYIANLIADKRINVIVFDLLLPEEGARRKDITYVRGNLLEPEDLRKALTSVKSVDSVIHTASLIPFLGVPDQAIWTVNVGGTKTLTTTCSQHGVKYFIYTSSATASIDRSCRMVNNQEESAPLPKKFVDTYAATKFAAERIVLEENKSGGMVTCSLRPGGIFGRGDKLLADRILQGIDLFYIGDGTARIDFVPVESVAMAHVLAEESLFSDPQRRERMQGSFYFIGNNEQRQYGWFMGAPMDGESSGSTSHWGQPLPKQLPLWLVMMLGYVNLGIYTLTGFIVFPPSLAPSLVDWTQRTYTFSSDRAKRDFGYEPKEKLADAIKRLAAENMRRKGS